MRAWLFALFHLPLGLLRRLFPPGVCAYCGKEECDPDCWGDSQW